MKEGFSHVKDFKSEIKRIKPNIGRVIVETIDETELKTASGIIMIQKNTKIKALKGTVIRACAGSALKPGDLAWYNNGIGTEISEGTKTYLVLPEGSLHCFVQEEPELALAA